ncbi:MAG: hypothetical protein MR605_00410 [Bacteroidales bacterium]|nr:hypothetical protein [Bacteroidales bacterium]
MAAGFIIHYTLFRYSLVRRKIIRIFASAGFDVARPGFFLAWCGSWAFLRGQDVCAQGLSGPAQ